MFSRTLFILSLSSICIIPHTLAEQGAGQGQAPGQAPGKTQGQPQLSTKAPLVKQQAHSDLKTKAHSTKKQVNCPAKLTIEQVRKMSEPEKDARGYSKEAVLNPIETGTFRLRLVSPLRDPGPLGTLKSKLNTLKGSSSGSWDLKNDEILGGAAGQEQFLCTYENPQVKDPKAIKVSSHLKK
jgi:hypothetical protein